MGAAAQGDGPDPSAASPRTGWERGTPSNAASLPPGMTSSSRSMPTVPPIRSRSSPLLPRCAQGPTKPRGLDSPPTADLRTSRSAVASATASSSVRSIAYGAPTPLTCAMATTPYGAGTFRACTSTAAGSRSRPSWTCARCRHSWRSSRCPPSRASADRVSRTS